MFFNSIIIVCTMQFSGIVCYCAMCLCYIDSPSASDLFVLYSDRSANSKLEHISGACNTDPSLWESDYVPLFDMHGFELSVLLHASCAVFCLRLHYSIVLVKLKEHLEPAFGVIQILEISYKIKIWLLRIHLYNTF